jgi:hypothetical protein
MSGNRASTPVTTLASIFDIPDSRMRKCVQLSIHRTILAQHRRQQMAYKV